MLSIGEQWRIYDFPFGGHQPHGGQHQMRALFGENVCENEKIGRLGGAASREHPRRSAPPMVR